LHIFLTAAVEVIFYIGCSYTNVVEYPRFLVCEAFSLDEYFSAFWRHQVSLKRWEVVTKWHSIDLRRISISGLFLFLMSYAVVFLRVFFFATNLKLAWRAEHKTFVPSCFHYLQNSPKTMPVCNIMHFEWCDKK
jgi:hypothetical protein